MSLAEDYRNWFISNLHDALSGASSADLDEAVRLSEQSQTKCIGITIGMSMYDERSLESSSLLSSERSATLAFINYKSAANNGDTDALQCFAV